MKRRSSRQDFRPGAPLGKVDQRSLYVNTLQVFFRFPAKDAEPSALPEVRELAASALLQGITFPFRFTGPLPSGAFFYAPRAVLFLYSSSRSSARYMSLMQ